MELEKWLDISSETIRTYLYADGEVEVDEPLALLIKPSHLGGDAHRITTKDGFGFYIKPGWLAIYWQVGEDEPIFKF